MGIPSITPGLLTTRAEMDRLFGGGSQAGIIPSTTTPNILIYVDHDSGKQYGYEDGWLAEEDELGPIFEYTGQGTSGDQTFLGRKGSRNAAVLYHAVTKKSLHVFMAEGKVANPKSSAKQQRYIGEFALDPKQPYTVREAKDENRNRRRIIVFRLRPKGEFELLSKDAITRAEKTAAQQVLAAVATPKVPEPNLVSPKRKRTSESRRAAQPSLTAELRQSELREGYLMRLIEEGHEVAAYQIRIAGTTTLLTTDLYDATEHELYSVRGESSREEVRTAIGQLKDYVRHIDPANPKLVTLLPEKPQDDLLNLLHTEGIDLVYQNEGEYTRIPSR
ncbi:hypothetical protein GQF42_18030 [Streptomyces broussonetiae]|uniref:ScoMcrA-like SRA domain-containing protein n=1 Tax=Streptomyces broussonetiae TaxID=2686304 RepID=A0A6I6N7K4_9ACTN|nr:hypothetical protein [Streptomyces broussonetiae]QHA04945.1 hypothetical protein GQF42_18030 [Streptomyces broussonetiae]